MIHLYALMITTSIPVIYTCSGQKPHHILPQCPVSSLSGARSGTERNLPCHPLQPDLTADLPYTSLHLIPYNRTPKLSTYQHAYLPYFTSAATQVDPSSLYPLPLAQQPTNIPSADRCLLPHLSYPKTLSALRSSPVDYRPSTRRTHTTPKSMLVLPLPVTRLKCPLHNLLPILDSRAI
jgi:hypothetical protein